MLTHHKLKKELRNKEYICYSIRKKKGKSYEFGEEGIEGYTVKYAHELAENTCSEEKEVWLQADSLEELRDNEFWGN